jgi:arylsulfatase A-like enzyme
MMTRSSFIRTTAAAALGAALVAPSPAKPEADASRPNVILCMTDDQGWGDTGYNGHPRLHTPNLDAMARSGVRFNRFYTAAPVCSPTRGSCLTGRHPFRYGIFFANVGHLPKKEMTLAEVLKEEGYATGHFGKWHLGTLTTTVKDGNRGGPKGKAHYSPPWDNGFDTCFSTEAKVPTYDPMVRPPRPAGGDKWWDPVEKGAASEPYGTRYWAGPGEAVNDALVGDDSRVIMDRALPFIRRSVSRKKPFFAVIWFHAPHWPVVAGPKHQRLYEGRTAFEKNYLGCITAMDEQVGRLRVELRSLGVADDTLLWFCSDNGPEGAGGKDGVGSAGPFRGRKRSLYEGGIRVPGILEWPRRIRKPLVIDMPCSTADYFTTVVALLGYTLKGKPRPYDGVNLLPAFEGGMKERPRPIGFESGNQLALTDNRYKLYSSNKGKTWELYDLLADPGEKKNIAQATPQVVQALSKTLAEWRQSCSDSMAGRDYGN